MKECDYIKIRPHWTINSWFSDILSVYNYYHNILNFIKQAGSYATPENLSSGKQYSKLQSITK